jgi:penicillin-binding protein 2
LSIDYGLQRELAAAIADQMKKANVTKASGVAIDPRSGEVLAMVSLPDYDNNLFSSKLSEAQYQQLIDNPLAPLTNKAISGSYPSGSVIKPLHLTAALQEGVVNEQTTIVDAGRIVVPNQFDPSISYVFNGWNPAGLGPMNARRAIAMSSDIYFYHTGGGYQGFKGLGVDRLTDYYRRYGLGKRSGIDLPGESAGLVPGPEWMQKTHAREWVTGDTYNISIGQGDLRVSPLQMAVGISALLNQGKLVKPHLFKKTADNSQVAKTEFSGDAKVAPGILQVAREGMHQVIGGTTAVATFAGVPVPVAGKSGTAETDPTTKRRAHAWYVAYAPYDQAEITFSVLLEEGEGGSQFAAPAIARAMQYYFSHKPAP